MKILICLIPLALAAAVTKPQARLDSKASQDPEGPDFASCETCHAEIHAEWKPSAHGIAWTDPVYQKSLKSVSKRQRKSCYRCHIPEPLQVTGYGLNERGRPKLPKTRADHHDFGIHCTSCHMDANGAMRGPFGGETKAHASVRDEAFTAQRSDALCLTCHSTKIGPVLAIGRDFVKTKQAERGRSCVGCHMEPVTRSMGIYENGDPAPTREGRSHALLGPKNPAFLAKVFTPAVKRLRDGQIRVRLTNTGAGHGTPGLKERTWHVRATPLDANGKPLRRAGKLNATIDHETPVLPDQAAEWTFDPKGEAAAVHLHIELHHPGKSHEPTLAIDQKIEL